MAEDIAEEAGSASADTVAGEHPKAEGRPLPEGGAAEAREETSAKGILREAIRKVMEEIEHHEREARKHLQQAKALRKDLRDSFAFLQERKEDEPTAFTGQSRSNEGAGQEAAAMKDMLPASKPQRGSARKKQAARKGKG